jgi:hypothetical protein
MLYFRLVFLVVLLHPVCLVAADQDLGIVHPMFMEPCLFMWVGGYGHGEFCEFNIVTEKFVVTSKDGKETGAKSSLVIADSLHERDGKGFIVTADGKEKGLPSGEVAVLKERNLILVAQPDKYLLFDSRTGKEVAQCANADVKDAGFPFPGWTGVSPLFGPDRNVFLIRTQEGLQTQHLSVFLVEPFRQIGEVESISGYSLNFACDQDPAKIVMYDLSPEAPIRFYRAAYTPEDKQKPVKTVEFDAVAKGAFWAGWRNGLKFWQTADDTIWMQKSGGADNGAPIEIHLQYSGHANGPPSLSEDGKTLLTVDRSSFQLWDIDYPTIRPKAKFNFVFDSGSQNIRLVKEQ